MMAPAFIDEEAEPVPVPKANGHDAVPLSPILDAGEDEAPIPPRGWLLGSTFCRGSSPASSPKAQPARPRSDLRRPWRLPPAGR